MADFLDECGEGNVRWDDDDEDVVAVDDFDFNCGCFVDARD